MYSSFQQKRKISKRAVPSMNVKHINWQCVYFHPAGRFRSSHSIPLRIPQSNVNCRGDGTQPSNYHIGIQEVSKTILKTSKLYSKCKMHVLLLAFQWQWLLWATSFDQSTWLLESCHSWSPRMSSTNLRETKQNKGIRISMEPQELQAMDRKAHLKDICNCYS